MKKFILTSCLFFITISMFAFTPLRFGVQIGLNANIGIEIFNKAQVSLGYNVGTSQVNKEAKAQKTKNRTTTLSIAYLF